MDGFGVRACGEAVVARRPVGQSAGYRREIPFCIVGESATDRAITGRVRAVIAAGDVAETAGDRAGVGAATDDVADSATNDAVDGIAADSVRVSSGNRAVHRQIE